MIGWIKLYRKLVDNPYYFSEKFCRGMAWVDMLLLANHAHGFFYKRGIRVEVQSGQIGYDIESLAKRWKWSRNKVTRWLNDLENSKQIVRQKTNVTTLITIVNYSIYQGNGIADEQANELPKGKPEGKPERHKQEGIRMNKKFIEADTNTSFNFYLEQVTKAKEYPSNPMAKDYIELCRRICKKDKDGSYDMYFVLNIQKQISIDQFSILYERSGKNLDSIIAKVDSVQNKVIYHNTYTDLFKTINTWFINDFKRVK